MMEILVILGYVVSGFLAGVLGLHFLSGRYFPLTNGKGVMHDIKEILTRLVVLETKFIDHMATEETDRIILHRTLEELKEEIKK